MLQTFHFLRPEWLLGILPVALLLFLFVRRSNQKSGWEDICDLSLLQYQLAQQKNNTSKSARFFHWIVPLVFLLTIVALAGPAWEKKEQPVFQHGSALVIILDLSLSMNAKDLKPSRIERAKLKIIDILKQKKEGQTALIAFAGDAHTVSPLTIDNKTIISLLPALETSIMPLPGSHITDALLTAEQLFKNSGFVQGDILLMTDGIDSAQQSKLKRPIKKLNQQGYTVSIIGVGSQAGSPIPVPGRGGFVKDASGQVVLSKLTPAPLNSLARLGGGSYHRLSLDDSDYKALLNKKFMGNESNLEQDNQVEQWVDAGAYVTLLLLPFALLAFRKGLLTITVILVISPTFFSGPVFASESTNESISKRWHNLWSTADQQGQKAFNNLDYPKAADKFSDQSWKAGAYYRSGEFDKAAEQYAQFEDANSLYNKGNALANLKKFDEAIQAYEEALEKNPQLNDAITNRDYLKKLLAQQEKQSSDQQSNSSDEQSEAQEQEKNSQNNQSEKNSDQNNSEQNSESGEDGNSNAQQEGNPQQDEPSAGKEPSANKESPTDQESSTDQEPSAGKESSTDQEPSAIKESSIDKELTNPDGTKQQAKPEPLDPLQEQGDQEANQEAQVEDVLSQLSQEEQQSLKQWLQRIPDKPGELLRIKFRNNSLLKQRQQDPPARYEGTPW